MLVSVSLDGDNRRDLQLFSGDDTEIVLKVYAKDGDRTPIAVSDARIFHGKNGGPVGSFRTRFNDREPYSITCSINGNRTTVAYGQLIRKWTDYCGRYDDRMYEPLFVRNEIDGGQAGSYFEGPGMDGGTV